mmetsp:Transcript_16761/g.38784  ORF Transcript_16761/g.38784 Transcript_16761/m.38784 type:complete len:91 (+) Transcript_16761:321-593(+)
MNPSILFASGWRANLCEDSTVTHGGIPRVGGGPSICIWRPGGGTHGRGPGGGPEARVERCQAVKYCCNCGSKGTPGLNRAAGNVAEAMGT